MRILITGGTGYLGRAIVHAARARGHQPVVLARRASASGIDADAVDGDVRDRSALGKAMAGCDAVCHTAALVAVWRPRRRDFDEINVTALHTVFDVAREQHVARIVYTSSFLALPPAGSQTAGDWNDYQRTKAEANRVAIEASARGVPVIRLYPGVIYGPGAATEGNLVGRMMADHFAGRLPGLIGADRIWSFAYVDDVAAAHVTAAERGHLGAAYALGGENRPQIAPFEVAREVTGRHLPRRIPGAAGRAVALIEEALAATIGRVPQLTRGTVTILEHDWPLDHAAASADLGYTVTPLADGVRRLLESIGVVEGRA